MTPLPELLPVIFAFGAGCGFGAFAAGAGVALYATRRIERGRALADKPDLLAKVDVMRATILSDLHKEADLLKLKLAQSLAQGITDKVDISGLRSELAVGVALAAAVAEKAYFAATIEKAFLTDANQQLHNEQRQTASYHSQLEDSKKRVAELEKALPGAEDKR